MLIVFEVTPCRQRKARPALIRTAESGQRIDASDRYRAWTDINGSFVVLHFAIGDISPLYQSRAIRRFSALPLDRQLRYCVVKTTEPRRCFERTIHRVGMSRLFVLVVLAAWDRRLPACVGRKAEQEIALFEDCRR
jgi:hypothetical protein